MGRGTAAGTEGFRRLGIGLVVLGLVLNAPGRDFVRALDEPGISVASATFEAVGLPPLRLQATLEGLRVDGQS